MRKALLLPLLVSLAAGMAQAQVEVVDSSPQRAAGQQSAGAPEQQMELYYQLQTLQQEVMELRGQVEEQAHELQRLKQQSLDNYLDLDRRVSALTIGGSSNAAAPALPPTSASVSGSNLANITPTPNTSVNTDASERSMYNAAYDLLKQRAIDESIAAFESHLQVYPRGEYAGNSYYWLGEIYLLKNDLAKAEEWFGNLLREFPDNRKVHDTQFKLGRVYHLQGKSARAEELLKIVAASSSDASRLARQYLDENF